MSKSIPIVELPADLILCGYAGIEMVVDAQEIQKALMRAYAAGVSVGDLVPEGERPYVSIDTHGPGAGQQIHSILGGPCRMVLNFPSVEAAVAYKLRSP